jgi:hypothetical protein
LLALLLVAFIVIQSSPGTAATNDGDPRELERLEAEWNAAHVRGDAAAIGTHICPRFGSGRSRHARDEKADSLGMFRSGRMKFVRYETSETKLRTYTDPAILTGRLRRTRVIAGATADDDWPFTKFDLRRDSRWRVVSFHASNTNS